MRKTINLFCIALTAMTFLAFSWSTADKYEELLDNETKSQYLFTTDNDILKTNLLAFLPNVFDQIDRIDAHRGDDIDYYFTIYGEKDGQQKAQIVLVSEVMACQQSFPSIKQIGIENAALIIYCYWETIEIGDWSIKVCSVDGTGAICGVSPSDGLCVQVKDIDPQPIEP